MSNLIVLPMVIPILIGIILIFLRPYIKIQRLISVISIILTGGLSLYLLSKIQKNGIMTLEFGDWEAHFEIVFVIVFVADSFSMLLVVTTSFVTLVCLLYAFATIGKSLEWMFFYSFVQFLIAGVNGSFLTGDLFNLFVCFEVMLVASYILVMIG